MKSMIFIWLMAAISALAQETGTGLTNMTTEAAQTNKLEARFQELAAQLEKLSSNWTPDRDAQYEKTVRELQKEFPNREETYSYWMLAVVDGTAEKAKSLAQEMINSPAPEDYKRWAKGVLYRLDSLGKPVSIQFKALDGQKVDLRKLTGKVVLVDFWSTDCGPCIQTMPAIKKLYDDFHKQGLEVIGISCDEDAGKLRRFVTENGIPWPQYFDGKGGQHDNKFTQMFGINGIPHMMLLDKKGCLRFDIRDLDDFGGTLNATLDPKNQPAGSSQTIDFKDTLAKLLAE